jgi:hypothetical protein
MTNVPRNMGDRLPRFKKPTGKPVKPSGLLRVRNVKHGLGWEPDRFMYRTGPVPLETDRTGLVPTDSANRAHAHDRHLLRPGRPKTTGMAYRRTYSCGSRLLRTATQGRRQRGGRRGLRPPYCVRNKATLLQFSLKFSAINECLG